MYNELRAKVQALIEDVDVEKAAHSMAKSVSDYKEVDDEDIEDQALTLGRQSFDYDDVEEEDALDEDSYALGSHYNNLYNAGASLEEFDRIAVMILNGQKKLGALKSLSVKTLSLSEARKNRLKELGLLSVISLSGLGLTTAGIIGYIKAKGDGKGSKLARGAASGGAYAGYSVAMGGAVAAGVSAAGAISYHNRRSVCIEAKYAYGTKLYLVLEAKPEQVKSGIDKEILKFVTKRVSDFKNSESWKVKEDVSMFELDYAILEDLILEEVTETQLTEDAILDYLEY